ncbi:MULTISPECIES: glycosyltransferase [Streptacidiphilus]|uniref:D-inositol 3-phosphate glycosyltransferase n=1 Tax=Streptacidiphilus cavernicola TaxID=3342716 RepID=A0ABV6USM2_9ACTN|nr:glycosyltransferase [Streptacidiphilus jeojiense]
MRVLVFGTYDTSSHPRVGIIADGLRSHGMDVEECNVPLGLDTAGRVAMLAQPWRVPLLLLRLADRWWRLARTARKMPRPDVILVGYLGHFDVRLARLLFRRTPIVLDHLISASDTAKDRRLSSGGLKQVLLRAIDAGALKAATVVVVDTEEHRLALPEADQERAVVVPVGAPGYWFEAGAAAAAAREAADPATDPAPGPLSVVFYGLFTPLQGAPVITEALAALDGAGVELTMIGRGQDSEAARSAAPTDGSVRWLDWVPAAELPALVAGHDVCLGIFGTGPKALRVVPNKVFQGAAAGCALITSDTEPQRRELGDAAVLVPPGDPAALAAALRKLAEDRGELDRMKQAARAAAEDRFGPAAVVQPLVLQLSGERPPVPPRNP